ncbi:MAG: shikimate kinase [Acidimicrobiia bacterium]
MSGAHLVLVGLMGAGKTTVGQRCAQLLDRAFVDTDDIVVATTGMSVAEIFERHGEARFRELERDAVADACASPDPLVIACGGGAVLDPATRKRLHQAGLVVWLQAPPEVLGARVGDGSTRPLLRDGNVATLERLAALRGPAYEDAADVVVDTTGRSVDEVAAVVVGELQSWNA